MPKCRYCGSEINRLDKEVCPLCGHTKPLEGISDETVDYTHVINAVDEEREVVCKSRILSGVLAILLGFLGIHNFYLAKYKLALINLLESAVGIGGLGSILFFFTGLGVWGYLIPYFIILALNIWIGVTFFVRHDLKDGRGEILK
ncbi:MAG: TM2 domain-containing protein [Bacilli bacterium]|nr:TM2 domain-containing protein [Bacilli bacterium]